jgi:hypothetical protein
MTKIRLILVILATTSVLLVPRWCIFAQTEDAKPVLSLNLDGCPEGAVLEFKQVPEDKRRFGRPNPEVDKFFINWVPGLSGWKGIPSNMGVRHENGISVLVHFPDRGSGMPGRTLVGGLPTWMDYDIEASVRLVDQTIIPEKLAYGENTSLPHIGIFARSTDSIRFYMLALEPNRAVLYLKKAREWIKLGTKQMFVNPDTYYLLRLSVSGDSLKGYVDGRLILNVKDKTYLAGKAGARFNTEARVRSIQVLMTPSQKADSERAKLAFDAETTAARMNHPKPVVLKTIDLPGSSLYPAHLRSAESIDFIVVGKKTWAIDLDGKILWEYQTPMTLIATGKPDKMGISRIVGLAGDKFVMLDGRNGQPMHETNALLPPLIYGPWRLGNLTGKGEVNYVARSGDNTSVFTVYDENLKVLFQGKTTIEIGHTHGLGFWDVDGDGKEELLAGGSCFRGDGSHFWDSRVAEAHLDQVVIGPLGPYGEPISVFLGLDEGVTFIDGISGERLSLTPNGHPQNVVVGDFRPDLPGLEVLTISRWASYGVTGLFNWQGEVLKQWMLAGEELPQLALPVTWGNDASELIMVSLLFRPPTLYDGFGREIFQLPEAPGYRPSTSLFPLDVTGDGRDEIFSINGTRLVIYTQDSLLPEGVEKRPSTIKWVNMSLPARTLRHGENLILNGSFEEIDAAGKPIGWRLDGKASLIDDPAKVFDGQRAVSVNFDNPAWTEFQIKPETLYVVTGMVRHAEHTAEDPGRLKILFKSGDGMTVGSASFRVFGLTANRYKGFYYIFRTPALATICHFGLHGRFTGRDYILYDHVIVRQLVEPSTRIAPISTK